MTKFLENCLPGNLGPSGEAYQSFRASPNETQGGKNGRTDRNSRNDRNAEDDGAEVRYHYEDEGTGVWDGVSMEPSGQNAPSIRTVRKVRTILRVRTRLGVVGDALD